MAGINSKALSFGDPENKKKYNGIEEIGGFDLEDYDAQFRELDPQLGRWWEIDPEIENMEAWSPYASNYDNPVTYSDPLGDDPGFWNDIKSAAKETWNSLKEAPGVLYEGSIKVATAFNTYINPLTPVVELATGKSYESNFTVDKSRITAAGETLMVALPIAKVEGSLVKITEKAMTTVEEKAVVSTEISQTKSVGPITGYTDHGLNQSIGRDGGRGVNAASQLDAVNNPIKVVSQSGDKTKYVGKTAQVVLNKDGKVITTMGKSRGAPIYNNGNGNAALKRGIGLGIYYDPKKIR